MNNRRLFLLALGIVSFLALGLVATPFVSSMYPLAAKKDQVTRISLIKPGTFKVILLNNKPVAIFHPTASNIKDLIDLTPRAFNNTEVLRNPKVFIYYLESTYKGCGLTHAPINASPKAISPSNLKWPGGFMDMCHYGEWDYAGRAIEVYDQHAGLPDLKVPQYAIKGDIIYWPLPVEQFISGVQETSYPYGF